MNNQHVLGTLSTPNILNKKNSITDEMLQVYRFSAPNLSPVITTEGSDDPRMLVTDFPEDISPMCAGLSKLPATCGDSFIGLLKQKNLAARVWWANDRVAQGHVVDHNN